MLFLITLQFHATEEFWWKLQASLPKVDRYDCTYYLCQRFVVYKLYMQVIIFRLIDWLTLRYIYQ